VKSGILLWEPISVLIPVCNEVDVIKDVLDEWAIEILKLPPGSTVEFEDADSRDGTLEILKSYSDKYEFVRVYERANRDGFSNAVKRLLKNAKNDWMFVADSDGQYFASDIQFHLSKWKPGVEFVKGVKVNRQDGFWRRFLSFLINRFIVVYYGFPFLDYNSSHYLISKKLYKEIDPDSWFFSFSVNMEITLRSILSNRSYEVVWVRHSKRRKGVSRGNPPHKFLAYGIRAYKDLTKLKKTF
jgi:glycosyltransferase involved in cell wall biosynthesis